MPPETTIGAEAIRATMVAYRRALFDHEDRLNRLNVYPVPDGDTGTNMALTLDAVTKELEAVGAHGEGTATLADVCGAVAHGSLMGARGNSGVILSQLLRGVVEELALHDDAGPAELASALEAASDLAYRAVVRPAKGTILTVARAAAQGASEASGAGLSLVGVAQRARDGAQAALAETPKLLEALARAGVVDAGGAGYVLFFDSILSVLDGRPVPPPSGEGDRSVRTEPVVPAAVGGVELRYEVMYLLDVDESAGEAAMASFKEVWAGVGDSIVVVGGQGVWSCHIHTDDVGAAIEVALDVGRPRGIRVTDLAEQVVEEAWVRDAARDAAATAVPGHPGKTPRTAAVAVASGPGIARILRSLGVEAIVEGGQTMNPSAADLLEAVESLGSREVVLLPNNRNVVPVAMQIDPLTEKSVRVVATSSVVEGFAALLAYDPESGAEENALAMEESARRVVPGEVTRAVRDASTGAGEVRRGEWIGLVRSEVLVVSDSADGAARRVLEQVINPSHALVTIIEGVGASPAATRRITEWLDDVHPDVATEVHHGGQPLYPYLLGIE